MSRRMLGGLMFAALTLAVFGSAWAWWRAWSAPLVTVFFRPPFSVHGLTSGTPVRVQGVLVGQVASVGLVSDSDGRLRPQVNLSIDPAAIEDRGFAERLRGDRLREEVRRGLRARLVAVNPASGLLQVELLWVEGDPLPDVLDRDEIPATGGTLPRAMERTVRELERATSRDLGLLAQRLEEKLDAFFPQSDPVRAARLNVEWIDRTRALAEATDEGRFGPGLRRLSEAAARLRAAVEQADRSLDAEAVALVQVRLADASAALAAFTNSLEGSRMRMEGVAEEVSALLRSVSEMAGTWTRKVRSWEAAPPAR